MTTPRIAPAILDGCSVLPPLVPARPPGSARPAGTPPASHDKGKQPGAGRWRTLNRFVDATMHGLNGTAAKVWFILFRDTKPDGTATASIADLARRAGVTGSTAKRAVRTLRRRGLLAVVRRGGLRTGPSIYRVFATADSNSKGGTSAPVPGVKSRPVAGVSSAPHPTRDQNGVPTLDGSDAQTSRLTQPRLGG